MDIRAFFSDLGLSFSPAAPGFSQNLIQTGIVLALLLIVHRVAAIVIQKRLENIRSLYLWKKGNNYVFSFIAVLLIGRIWFEGVHSITTFLGLLSAGLAIALKDVIANVAAWMVIILERPFTPGDRIEVGGTKGDVIDLSLFKFTILEIGNRVDADQSTGRLIEIPNASIFSESIANSTKVFPYIWNEIPVLLTFESNWKKGKELLTEIITTHTEPKQQEVERSFRNARRSILIHYTALTPVIYLDTKDSGINLTIRYLCPVREKRQSEHELWEAILNCIEAHPDLDLAYPTIRHYHPESS